MNARVETTHYNPVDLDWVRRNLPSTLHIFRVGGGVALVGESESATEQYWVDCRSVLGHAYGIFDTALGRAYKHGRGRPRFGIGGNTSFRMSAERFRRKQMERMLQKALERTT